MCALKILKISAAHQNGFEVLVPHWVEGWRGISENVEISTIFFSCFGTLPLVSVSNTSKVYYDDVQHTQVLTCVKSSHLGTGKVDELHILDPRPLGGPPGLTGPGPPAWLPPPTLKGVSSLATFSLQILKLCSV